LFFFQISYFKIPTLQEGIEYNIFVTTRCTNVHMLHSVRCGAFCTIMLCINQLIKLLHTTHTTSSHLQKVTAKYTIGISVTKTDNSQTCTKHRSQITGNHHSTRESETSWNWNSINTIMPPTHALASCSNVGQLQQRWNSLLTDFLTTQSDTDSPFLLSQSRREIILTKQSYWVSREKFRSVITSQTSTLYLK